MKKTLATAVASSLLALGGAVMAAPAQAGSSDFYDFYISTSCTVTPATGYTRVMKVTSWNLGSTGQRYHISLSGAGSSVYPTGIRFDSTTYSSREIYVDRQDRADHRITGYWRAAMIGANTSCTRVQ